MADALCFTSFDKFKSEVAQRTRKALQQQQQSSGPVSAPPIQTYFDGDAVLPASDSRSRWLSERFSQDISNNSEIRQVEEADDSSRFRSFRSDVSSKDHIPIHERVPERLKHVPKSFTAQNVSESKKSVSTAPLSQRLLQMMPSKARSVVLYANDGQYNKAGVRILLPETMDLLLDLAVQKLNLPSAARLVFRTEDGSVVSNIDDIQDDDSLAFSFKEPFKPLQEAEPKTRPKGSLPVKTNNATKKRQEAVFSSLASGPVPAPSPSAQLKLLLQDAGRLQRRYRLALNTRFQRDNAVQIEQQRSMVAVGIVCGLGAVSLRNQGLTSLEGMPVQPDMAELYLQNNLLTSLEHFPSQPRLRELRLENNLLVSFKGFQPQPRLEQVWVEGSPISRHPHYRLMIAILQLNNYLTRIDNLLVEREDRLVAQALAPLVGDALRAGWLLETERQPEADMDMTVEDFQEMQEEAAAADSAQPGAAGAGGRVPGRQSGGRGAVAGEARVSGEGGAVLGAAAAAESPARSEEGGGPPADSDAGGRAGAAERMQGQIERLTDALVRASHKSSVKEKLLLETTTRLQAAHAELDGAKQELEDKARALADAQRLLAKRNEQCRQLYEIVGSLEAQMAGGLPAEPGPHSAGRSGAERDVVSRGCQTEEGPARLLAAGVGGGGSGLAAVEAAAAALEAQLDAERRSRAAEKAASDAKLERLEEAVRAGEGAAAQRHRSLLGSVRGRLMTELSYAIPDTNVLLALIKEIDEHMAAQT